MISKSKLTQYHREADQWHMMGWLDYPLSYYEEQAVINIV
jgi:hypothetical protein